MGRGYRANNEELGDRHLIGGEGAGLIGADHRSRALAEEIWG